MQTTLPFLPGMTEKKNYDWVSRTLQGGNFQKIQILEQLKSGLSPREKLEPEDDDLSASSGYPGFETSVAPILSPRQPKSPRSTAGSKFRTTAVAVPNVTLPRYVRNEKQILRFIGYFEEKCSISLVGKHTESAIVHKLQFQYFVDDGTLYVIEKAEHNSGLQNGVFFGRAQGVKTDGTFVEADDLIVGNTLHFLGREIFMAETDEFTKEYFLRERDRLISISQLPPYLQSATSSPSPPMSPRGTTADVSSKTFLEFDKQVLRFYGKRCRDDIEVVVHYYLADDTIELLRRTNRNCPLSSPPKSIRPLSASSTAAMKKFKPGRQLLVGQVSTILSRQVVPKNWRDHNNDLNSSVVPESLSQLDFQHGAVVNIFGNDVLIQSCDAFSVNFYRRNHPLMLQVLDADGEDGSDERNKAMVQSEEQAATLQKRQFDGKMVMFLLTKVSEIHPPVDNGGVDKYVPRRFILRYFLEDDSFSVFEEAIVNNGNTGGQFLKRGIYKNPRDDGKNYKSSLFFIGSRIMLPNAIEMEIIDMDLTSHDVLASYNREFPLFDAGRVCHRLVDGLTLDQVKSLTNIIASLVTSQNKKTMESNDFDACLSTISHRLSRQEVLTIKRSFRQDSTKIDCKRLSDMIGHVVARQSTGVECPLAKVRGDWRALLNEKVGRAMNMAKLAENGVSDGDIQRIVELASASRNSTIDDICDSIYRL